MVPWEAYPIIEELFIKPDLKVSNKAKLLSPIGKLFDTLQQT